MRQAKEAMLGLLYPRRCPVCFEIVAAKGKLVCPECRGKLRYLQEPLCKGCGAQLAKEEQEYCHNCRQHPKSFAAGISLFQYASVSRALLAFKYKDKREYADFFAWELAGKYGTAILQWKPDALIPVPLHPLRRLGRGYNQAEVLAKRLGALLGLPVRSDVLRRVRYTNPQKRLPDSQRRANLQAAFHASPADLQTVVLIDDIYTTGSTAEACTRALRSAGIKTVYVVTVAGGQNGS